MYELGDTIKLFSRLKGSIVLKINSGEDVHYLINNSNRFFKENKIKNAIKIVLTEKILRDFKNLWLFY